MSWKVLETVLSHLKYSGERVGMGAYSKLGTSSRLGVYSNKYGISLLRSRFLERCVTSQKKTAAEETN